MDAVKIRRATESDASAIAEIYNHAITTSTATFDTEEKSADERRRWLAEHDSNYPVIVAEVDGEVVGWGSLSRYGERPGWRFTVENAVYVRHDYRGRGIGKLLLEHLIEEARNLGYHCIIAQVVGGNDASFKLHEHAGFETAGVLREAGRKFDRWLDVILMQKLL
jgi:phosphinothricin acetyltransferase